MVKSKKQEACNGCIKETDCTNLPKDFQLISCLDKEILKDLKIASEEN